MKVTLNHPKSKQGFQVIVDDVGRVIPDHEGMRLILGEKIITEPMLAAACGIEHRTLGLYGTKSRSRMPANVLNMLGLILECRSQEDIERVLNLPRRTTVEQKVVRLHKAGMSFAQIALNIMGDDGEPVSKARAHQIYVAAMGKKR